MLVAMLIVMLTWLILFCLMAGLGQFVISLFKLRLTSLEAWLWSVWSGYAVVIGVLQLWHLIWPIDWRVDLFLGVFGLIGLLWSIVHIHWSKIHITKALMLKSLLIVLIFAPMVIWIANRALDAQIDFDTGLYHLSLIHWLNAYPVVPGLGNLHYRLAFNQTFFMFVAALNVYPFFNQGFHIANSFLLIVLALQLTHNVIHAIVFPREISLYRLLSVLLLPVVMYRATYQLYSANVSSPSPDLSVFIFQVVVMLAFVKLISTIDMPENEQRFMIFFCIALSIVGITSKLSFAAFGVLIIGFVCLLWCWQQRGQLIKALRQSAIWLLLSGCLIGLPWMAHGIVTSGYPAFPSTFGAVPVDYKIPTAIASDAANWILAFAKDPHGEIAVTLSSWDWLSGWEDRVQEPFDEFLFVFPLFAFVILLPCYLLLLGLLRFLHKQPTSDHRLWLPLLPSFVSAVFWFLTAPDPRFAGAVFWLLTLWTGLLVLNLLKDIRLPMIFVRIGVALPVAFALVLVISNISTGFKMNSVGFPTVPVAAMKPYQTDSGLIINIPANLNNPLQLWDAPLPASPYTYPQLELRGNNLSDGFRMSQP